jgi:hypothetical protein
MMPNQKELLHPVLPRLKEGRDNKVGTFPRKGEWHGRPAVELDNLSESLKTERLEFEVNAIPDMWARAILFEIALVDPDHPIHQRILGEWRGMLALLALRKVRRFGDLTVKTLIFKDEAKESEDLDFLVALSKVKPQKRFAEDSTWKHTYIILSGGRPIAITSPITLVCTATYYGNCLSDVSWYDGRFLVDPTQMLNVREKKLLASWLKQLKKSLVNHEGINNRLDEFEQLLKLFDKYIADLGDAREDVMLSTEVLGMKEGIYQYLDRPIFVSEEMAVQSHVQVVPSKEDAPEEDLLVIDKEISKQWKIPEKDINVYRSIPLDRISLSKLVGDRTTLLDSKLEKARWCKPEDFFTEKLVLIKEKNALPGTLDIEGIDKLSFQGVSVTPIVPLTGLILPYLAVEDISHRLRFDQMEDEFKVTFHLPLTGPEATGKDFAVSKTYRVKENEVESVPAVPALETWPNFISSKWKAYYTYFSTVAQETFYATPLNAISTQNKFKGNKDRIEQEINYLDHFPELFECKLYRMDPRNKKPVPYNVGILMVKKPMPLPSLGKQLKIGVDFGSSSTNVFLKEVYSEPERVILNDNSLNITAIDAVTKDDFYKNFLPGKEVPAPFLSVFHDFLISKSEIKALLDGHIYFPGKPQEFDAVMVGMMTDLKWGTPDERRRARTFLEQGCLQFAAEAAVRGAVEISWRFSFPTSLSQDEKDAFISHWKSIIYDNHNLTGIAHNDNMLPYYSESIAAARYFANKKDISAALPRGAVFIDVGGRTSDISIWGRNNELMMQTSLQLAGRDIFAYPLLEKTGLLVDLISSEELSVLNREDLKKNPLAFCAQLDAIISTRSSMIMKKLPHYGGEANMKGLKQLMGLAFSGLIYYVGLFIKSFPDRQKYIENVPNIYFAGNGSRLLQWLASGDFNEESAYNRLLKSIFKESYGISNENSFEIKISPEPKAEVACGLVMDETPLTYSNDIEGCFISGEAFTDKGNKEYDWQTRITTGIMKSGIKITSNQEQFKKFLKVFDVNAGPLGILQIEANDDIMEKTRDQVNKEISNMKFQKESEMRIEPLFILELKEFLKLKVREWARK